MAAEMPAPSARDEHQRQQTGRQVQLVLDDMDDALLPYDDDSVRDLARRAQLALLGDVGAAYRDRAGRLRSVQQPIDPCGCPGV